MRRQPLVGHTSHFRAATSRRSLLRMRTPQPTRESVVVQVDAINRSLAAKGAEVTVAAVAVAGLRAALP